ncbi:hypothetical protein M501DRAFT_943640 [Patellaria atrata CBS 101060]|uniref:Dynactin subunit 4 n=1 Tax=Patellaria atrata CBS 101060 TaxID=1346257 RepID=A0A9P4S3C4_9PEZI|nr:hypothetical protein M501DRAFT_943640 [Patellaria atrata CBS 101060]
MAQPFPYTYYACSCTDDTTTSSKGAFTRARFSANENDDEEDQTFDPRSPRANYSLFPLENLLYCAECQTVRCSRCVTEEIACWFCPSCLFEVPSSMVRSEGNRCTRNCYNCPICTSPMTVNPLDTQDRLVVPDAASVPGGPFYLSCPYCAWSSLDIGIKFERASNITGQLARIKNGGKVVPTLKERERERDRKREKDDKRHFEESTQPSSSSPLGSIDEDTQEAPNSEETFSDLTAFYKNQISISNNTNGSMFNPHDINFGSPSSITRLMSLYGRPGAKPAKKDKPQSMREAYGSTEGFFEVSNSSEDELIERIRTLGWSGTTSIEQRSNQPPHNSSARFLDDIRPIPTLLRTKQSKRCRSCRNILVRPDNKVSSTRYKIKLLALNYIPRVTIRALAPPPPVPSTSTLSNATALRPTFDYDHLQPSKPTHFLLTLRNPLFDPLKVTLATPSYTSGRINHKVTIMCPQFDVGANTDVWDEALNAGTGSKLRNPTSSMSGSSDNGGMQVEAGKIWEKGRNWTSVIVEVIPGRKPISLPGSFGSPAYQEEELDEDDDVLEIPVFVRLEYEVEADKEEKVGGSMGQKTKKEDAFWCVLGVGRVVV